MRGTCDQTPHCLPPQHRLPSKPLQSSRLKFVLRVLVSLALIGFVLRKLDWHQVGALLQKTDPVWGLFGSALTLGLILLLALRWSLFLRRQSIPVPFSTIFSLTWSGQFFNSVLPGSTGGDFVKIFQLCRLAPDRKSAAAVTVVLDRFTALIALLCLAGVAFLRCPISWSDFARIPRPGGRFIVIAGITLALVGTGGAVFVAARSQVWLPRLRRVIAALKTSITPSPALALAIGMSFTIHLLSFFIAFCFARSLGIGITYWQVLEFFPVLLFLVMMPITVNGHGLREVLLIFYFSKLGIVVTGQTALGVQETAIAFSALLVANDLAWSLPGGIWYLLRFRSAPAVKPQTTL